jgi:GAF domain-containing protein
MAVPAPASRALGRETARARPLARSARTAPPAASPGERLSQLVRLLDVTRLLASELDLAEISHRILVSAIEMIPAAQAGTLFLADSTTGKLQVQDSVGLGPTIRKLSLEPGECAAGRAFFSQHGAIYNDPGAVSAVLVGASTDNREAFRAATQGLRSPKAAMSVPLIFKADVLGALVVDKLRDSEDCFTEQDLMLLEDFGQIAAIGIANARLFDLERGTRLRLQVMNEELNRQRDLLDRRLRALDAMAQVAREGFSLDNLASRLAALACGRAMILDSLSRVRAVAPPEDGAAITGRTLDPDVVGLLERVGRDRQRHAQTSGGLALIASPVTAERDVLGYVLLEQREPPADSIAETLVDSAALIASAVFVREQSLEEGELQRRADLLEHLLNGDVPRTVPPGLRGPFRLAVGAMRRAREGGVAAGAQHSGMLRELRTVTAESIQRRSGTSAVAIRDDFVVAAWPVGGDQAATDWPAVYEEIADRMERHHGWRARFALTPVISDPQSVPQSYREARLALEVRPWAAGRVIDVGALGAYRLIIGATSSADAVEFSRRHLAEVIAHDRKRGGNLLPTLRTFLATGMSVTAAARELHVHAHTVQYRLGKVEELSGLSLRNCEERLTLELSLRISDLALAERTQP